MLNVGIAEEIGIIINGTNMEAKNIIHIDLNSTTQH